MREPIYDEVFLVSGPAVVVLDREYVKTVGVPANLDENGRVTSTGLNETRIVGMNVMRMAEIMLDGFTVSIIEPSHIKYIYQICADFVRDNRAINGVGIYSKYTTEVVDMVSNLLNEIVAKNTPLLEIAYPMQSFNRVQHNFMNTTTIMAPDRPIATTAEIMNSNAIGNTYLR